MVLTPDVSPTESRAAVDRDAPLPTEAPLLALARGSFATLPESQRQWLTAHGVTTPPIALAQTTHPRAVLEVVGRTTGRLAGAAAVRDCADTDALHLTARHWLHRYGTVRQDWRMRIVDRALLERHLEGLLGTVAVAVREASGAPVTPLEPWWTDVLQPLDCERGLQAERAAMADEGAAGLGLAGLPRFERLAQMEACSDRCAVDAIHASPGGLAASWRSLSVHAATDAGAATPGPLARVRERQFGLIATHLAPAQQRTPAMHAAAAALARHAAATSQLSLFTGGPSSGTLSKAQQALCAALALAPVEGGMSATGASPEAPCAHTLALDFGLTDAPAVVSLQAPPAGRRAPAGRVRGR